MKLGAFFFFFFYSLDLSTDLISHVVSQLQKKNSSFSLTTRQSSLTSAIFFPRRVAVDSVRGKASFVQPMMFPWLPAPHANIVLVNVHTTTEVQALFEDAVTSNLRKLSLSLHADTLQDTRGTDIFEIVALRENATLAHQSPCRFEAGPPGPARISSTRCRKARCTSTVIRACLRRLAAISVALLVAIVVA